MKKVSIAFILVLALASPAAAREILAPEVPVKAAAPLADKDHQAADILVLPAGHVIGSPAELFTEGSHGENVVMPHLLSNPDPIVYPRWAVRQGWEGQINIAIEILTDGTVGRTKIMQSTGYRMLDDAAHKAVKSWRFQPAMENGKAVVTCIQIPVRFQLDRG